MIGEVDATRFTLYGGVAPFGVVAAEWWGFVSVAWLLALLLRPLVVRRSGVAVCGRFARGSWIVAKGWSEVAGLWLSFSFLEARSDGVDAILFAVCFRCCVVDDVDGGGWRDVEVLAFSVEIVIGEFCDLFRRTILRMGSQGMTDLCRQVSEDNFLADVVDGQILRLLNDLGEEL